MRRFNGILVLPLLLAGCNPHVVIEQPKPLEININFNGHLDLVIHDARQDLETITGEKPSRVVRPEDIGLAPAKAGGAMSPLEKRQLARGEEKALVPVLLQNRPKAGDAQRFVFVGVSDDLKKTMAGRNVQIRALWDAKLVGEGHDGKLAAKAKLTEDQQKLMEAENTDRTALYANEAKEKATTVDDVALAYYVARLGYAKDGAWFEKKNAAGVWEWKQWGS